MRALVIRLTLAAGAIAVVVLVARGGGDDEAPARESKPSAPVMHPARTADDLAGVWWRRSIRSWCASGAPGSSGRLHR
jgi:hypothetical protein